MLPLQYQIGRSTCWATSIMNGIMFLREGELITSYQYKMANCVFGSNLWRGGVWYYEYDDERDLNSILRSLEHIFGIKVKFCKRNDAIEQIKKLPLGKDIVAVCDVGNGKHCILLNGIDQRREWASAFDPWWYEDQRNDNENVIFPDRNSCINVKIRLEHMLNDAVDQNLFQKGEAYPIGKNREKTYLTVISKE